MPQGSVLLIAQLAPPSSLIAARRVAGLTKYLARLGYRITVVTSAISGEGAIEGAQTVVRTVDLMSSPLNWRRPHFAALGGAAGLYRPPSRLQALLVPDLALVSWLPFALRSTLSLSRSHRFDCVLTSSPPQSAHLVGLALHRRGVPWIAELRDGWTFEPPHSPWALGLQRSLDRRLEESVLARADAVVAVTQPIVDDLAVRLGLDAVLITNGFDPEDDPPPESMDNLLDPKRHSIVHTGRMAVAQATPRPLLDAVRSLRSEGPGIAERFELVFAGPVTATEAELLAAPDLAGLVRAVGAVNHQQALRLQRSADSLLVVTEGAGRRSVATGKLFEYLAARRPILVLGEGTAAAEIVTRTGTGFATSSSDVPAIAAALKRMVESPPQLSPPETIEPYAYPHLAGKLATLIERVARD